MEAPQGDEHSKPDDWQGWNRNGSPGFALEIQKPWVDRILARQKTIEIRSYPLPPALLHQRIWILESMASEDGLSPLGDTLENVEATGRRAGEDGKSPCIVGWIKFSSANQYSSKQAFVDLEDQHCVPSNSPYAWTVANAQTIHGWVIESVSLETPSIQEQSTIKSLIRRKRSLFELMK